MGAAVSLWTCADAKPHPLAINYNWWQDRKLFGKDLKGRMAWRFFLKTGIGRFRRPRKENMVFFFWFAAAPLAFFDQMFENTIKTHGSKLTLADKTSPSAHTLLCDALLLWQPLWITEFCPYTGLSFFLPNTFFQLDLHWYADILRHVSMEHKFRPWQPTWTVPWRPASNLFQFFKI